MSSRHRNQSLSAWLQTLSLTTILHCYYITLGWHKFLENRLEIWCINLAFRCFFVEILVVSSLNWWGKQGVILSKLSSNIGGLCSTEKERLNLWLLYSCINQQATFINFSHVWLSISEMKWFFLCSVCSFWTHVRALGYYEKNTPNLKLCFTHWLTVHLKSPD